MRRWETLEYANVLRGRAPHDLMQDELVIKLILAIARYLHELCQHLYTRNHFDREILAKLEEESDSARSASEQERPDATPDDDCDEQLREVIGEL